MLLDMGCVIAGTAAKLDDALRIARSSEFDVALLDVNLGGKRVDPAAEAIRARGIPIIFVTGYTQGLVKHAFQSCGVYSPYKE